MTDQGGTPKLDAGALERILEVTRALGQSLPLDEMLTQVIDAGRSILHADRGTVFLHDEEKSELVSRVATGEGELRVPVDRGIVGECARTRTVINVPDVYADPRFNREIDKTTGYRTRCMMSIPLVARSGRLVGVLQVLNKEDGVFDDRDERIATALAAQCAVALQRSRLLEARVQKERMEQELSLARDIQMRVFPRKMPAVPGYDIAGWCRPADQTGGDIYDVIHRDDGTVLMLGDATGHGIAAALSVTQMRGMLRMCLRFSADIDAAFAHINDQLSEDLASNRFVTAFLGRLDTASHRIDFHSGGIGPLLHFHGDGAETDLLESSTFPLGILGGRKVEDARQIPMAPGDILILATDGIYEFENPAEEQYGVQRMLDVVGEYQNAPMSTLIERVVQDVEKFAQGAPQADDMTLLLIRRLPT